MITQERLETGKEKRKVKDQTRDDFMISQRNWDSTLKLLQCFQQIDINRQSGSNNFVVDFAKSGSQDRHDST